MKDAHLFAKKSVATAVTALAVEALARAGSYAYTSDDDDLLNKYNAALASVKDFWVEVSK